MNRRDFMQLAGLASSAGGAVACGVEKTSREDVKMDTHAKTDLAQKEVEHLRLAIQLSELSTTGPYGENHPFGAVIVLANGTVIKGHNRTRVDRDPTQHAELCVVSQACRSGLEASDFEGGTLYTSTEPCVMCCGAIYWAGIRRVVYACSHESLDRLFVDMFPESSEGGGLLMSSRDVFARGKARTEVHGPYLEQEAIAVHKRHWPKLLGVPAPAAWHSNG